MLKPIFEGELNIFLNAPAKDLEAGTLVKLTGEGTFDVAGAGEEIYGILAQDVQARNVDNFKLDSVTHVAYHNEKAGVYFQGGLYNVDTTADAVTAGAKLYAGASGQLTTTASGNAVATAEQDASAGEKVRIRFLG